jgi:hypothetical protein
LFESPFHTRAFYVGALPLMLAATGLMLRRSIERVGICVMGVLCLAIAVGMPPFPDLLALLPGFDVSNNSRLIVVFVLCFALLAGFGLHDLTSARLPRSSGILVVVGALILVTPVVWMTVAGDRPWASVLWDSLRAAWGFDFPDPRVETVPELQRLVAEVQAASLLEWLVPAAAGLLLIGLRVRGLLSPLPFAGLAVALVVVDLFKADVGFNPAISIDAARQPATPAIRHLRADVPNRFVGLAGNPLRPNLAMRYGLMDVRGYDFPIDERFMNFWRLAIAPPGCPYHFCTTGASATTRAVHALGLLSVAHLLTGPADPVIHQSGLHIAYDGPDGRIYSNAAAAARAFVVNRQRVVTDADAALGAVTSERFEPTAAAVTEEPVAGVPRSSVPRQSSPPPGTARMVDYRDERVTLEADAPRPGILVLTDTYAPGWKATVDGRRVPIHRVDYLLRGVQLGAGRHRVEFRYEPAGWRTGLVVSAFALAVLLALFVAALSRRRRFMGRTGLEPVTSGSSSR